MYDKIGYCCHFYVTFVPLFGLIGDVHGIIV